MMAVDSDHILYTPNVDHKSSLTFKFGVCDRFRVTRGDVTVILVLRKPVLDSASCVNKIFVVFEEIITLGEQNLYHSMDLVGQNVYVIHSSNVCCCCYIILGRVIMGRTKSLIWLRKHSLNTFHVSLLATRSLYSMLEMAFPTHKRSR